MINFLGKMMFTGLWFVFLLVIIFLVWLATLQPEDANGKKGNGKVP